ncbi:IS66 family transposase [Fluoribacter gormanii]|uniref:IS66 family transposase n=1 Tax=Fluoribacter gormanii TaxID=464 RepID=UPI000E1BBD0A|nr:transposase [Fluoribacter gormanii]
MASIKAAVIRIIKAWIVCYQNQHLIPEARIQQMFRDMYNLPITTASIAPFNKMAYEQLELFETKVLAFAQKAPVKNLDETGFRVGGKTQWMYTLSTPDCTYYHVSPKRKSLIDGVKGIAVHDLINALNPEWDDLYQSIL